MEGTSRLGEIGVIMHPRCLQQLGHLVRALGRLEEVIVELAQDVAQPRRLRRHRDDPALLALRLPSCLLRRRPVRDELRRGLLSLGDLLGRRHRLRLLRRLLVGFGRRRRRRGHPPLGRPRRLGGGAGARVQRGRRRGHGVGRAEEEVVP